MDGPRVRRCDDSPFIIHDSPSSKRSWRLALAYFRRAMRLRCPVCGRSPIFVPLRRTRSVMDWFTPLDGCPRCGYPYEREPGYFLFSLWVVNFFFVVFVALATYLVIEVWFDLSLPWAMILTAGPAPLMGFAIARHAKALFIALDHFIDPFTHPGASDGPGGGGPPLLPAPPDDSDAPAADPAGRRPEPVEAGRR